jgi:restriction system protein
VGVLESLIGSAASPNARTNEGDFFIHALVVMWPIWVLFVVGGACKLAVSVWRTRRLRLAGIDEIDRMSGSEFERKLGVLFRSLGFRAEVVGAGGGDYGADLVISRRGKKTVIQAKCWKNNVGVAAVQEVVGARGFYDAHDALVVTNSRYTRQARTLAAKNSVRLWDRDDLIAHLLKARKLGVPTWPDEVAVTETADPLVQKRSEEATDLRVEASDFCARCGKSVSKKARDYCIARPETFGGLIYCYDDQRAVRGSARAR